MRLFRFSLFFALLAPLVVLAQSTLPTSSQSVPASQASSFVPVLSPASTCGDGRIDGFEACDDGNTLDGDGCRKDCRKKERCGDGFLDEGEFCDDGNTLDGDSCPATCRVEVEAARVCGNGLIDLGETCDDGNTLDGDSCPADCFSLSLPDHRGKIPSEARRRALMATGLGAPLLGIGLIVGPSIGRFYAGEWRRGVFTSALRLAAAGLLVVGLAGDSIKASGALNFFGVVGLLGLGLYDVKDAPFAVKRMSLKPEEVVERQTVILYGVGLSAAAGAMTLGGLGLREAFTSRRLAEISVNDPTGSIEDLVREIQVHLRREKLFGSLAGVTAGVAVVSGAAGYLVGSRAKASAPKVTETALPFTAHVASQDETAAQRRQTSRRFYGVAVASLDVATLLGLLSLNEALTSKRLTELPSGQPLSEGLADEVQVHLRRERLFGNLAGVTAGVAVVSGAAGYLVGSRAKAHLTLTPAPGAVGAALAVSF